MARVAVDGAPTADPLPLPAAIVLAALAVAVLAQGAFYGTARAVVAVLLAAAAVGVGPSARRLPRPFLVACALFGGWALCRALVAGDAATARSTVALLAAGVVIVAACAACDAGQRDQLRAAIVALGVAAALSGWAGVAWRHAPWALQDQGLWRAATTITYANVAAGLLAALALLSVARAAPGPAASAASCVLLTGLGATLSRGGLVAMAAGALVLVRAEGLRTVARRAAAPVLGAGVALAGLLPSMPNSSEPRPLLAGGALVLGLLVAACAGRVGRRAVAAAVLAGACLLLAAGGRHLVTVSRPRLSAASPDRVEEAKAAVRLAQSRPLIGVGQGRADLTWVRPDGSVAVARYAHNEYLQVLAELGVVGLALLLGVLAAAGQVARRGRDPAVAAALAVLAVHGLFDFGWHLPAIPLTGALLLGLVAGPERKEQP